MSGVNTMDGEINENICGRFGISRKGKGMKVLYSGRDGQILRWFRSLRRL